MQLAGMTYDKTGFHKVYRHPDHPITFFHEDGKTPVHQGKVWAVGSSHFASIYPGYPVRKQSERKTVRKIGYTSRGYTRLSVYEVCEIRRGKMPPFRETPRTGKRSRSRDEQLDGAFYEPMPGRSNMHKVCTFQYRDGTHVSSKDKIITPPGRTVRY
jgi:hypothetical protein